MDRKSLLWIVIVFVALLATWQLASAQGEKGHAEQKWEYKVLSGGKNRVPDGQLLEELNELGNAGWELVAVEPATKYSVGAGGNIQTTERVFHFKRGE